MNILFWSGGKDSYLAWLFFRRRSEEPVRLLTTFNKSSGRIPHQDLPVSTVKEQAEHLRLDLTTVPLPDECPDNTYLKKIDRALKEIDGSVSHLIFGDWHLEDIRSWREEQFGKLGYKCLFPIWKKSIHELLPALILSPVEIRISAVLEEYRHLIKPGETYNQRFVQQLPKEIDPMGENGEFHTEVVFRKLKNMHR